MSSTLFTTRPGHWIIFQHAAVEGKFDEFKTVASTLTKHKQRDIDELREKLLLCSWAMKNCPENLTRRVWDIE